MTASGALLQPAITIPTTASTVTFGRDGTVSIELTAGGSQVIGQIQLARFVNPSGLESKGQNLMRETPASGAPQVLQPGVNGAGSLMQGTLEASNVNVVEEMVSMIETQRAYEHLERTGIGVKLYDRTDSLSGGQQQRVAVARAIVSGPTLVLADEPTANLDSTSATQLIELFVSLNRERGITFVIATHDTRVMAYCPRLIRMEDGKIISDEERTGKSGELQPQPS